MAWASCTRFVCVLWKWRTRTNYMYLKKRSFPMSVHSRKKNLVFLFCTKLISTLKHVKGYERHQHRKQHNSVGLVRGYSKVQKIKRALEIEDCGMIPVLEEAKRRLQIKSRGTMIEDIGMITNKIGL